MYEYTQNFDRKTLKEETTYNDLVVLGRNNIKLHLTETGWKDVWTEFIWSGTWIMSGPL
jgi:hypothetical protein